jgi:hypothetical protein
MATKKKPAKKMSAKAQRLQNYLRRHGACRSARDWASGKTLEAAWLECEFPTWLIWMADEIDKHNNVRDIAFRGIVAAWVGINCIYSGYSQVDKRVISTILRRLHKIDIMSWPQVKKLKL